MDNCEDSCAQLIETLPNAFARHRVITDKQGNPVDYTFLQVNSAFEEFTGLNRLDIINKRVTEVLPGIEKDGFDWIGTFGKIALGGDSTSFEQYSNPLQSWYEGKVYSDQPGHFTTVFNNISERKKAFQNLRFQNEKMGLLLDISTAIAEQRESNALCQIIADSVVKLTELNSSAIYLYKNPGLQGSQDLLENTDIHLKATYPALPNDFPDFLRDANTADHPHIAEAISKKHPVIVADSRTAELTPEEKNVCESRNLRSILYVPLIYQNKSIGVLIVSSIDETFGFSESIIELTRILAGQAALSISEANRSEELKHYVKEIEQKNRNLEEAERTVRKSEEKHRMLFETMSQGVVYHDAYGRIFSCNPAAERILGKPFIEIQGKTVDQLLVRMVDEEYRTVAFEEQPAHAALHTGKKIDPVIRGIYLPDSDSCIWLSITATPLFRPGDDMPYQTYASLEDITVRRQALRDLHHVGERYKALLDYSPLHICEFDLNGRYLMANPAIADLFALPLSELTGKSFQQLLPPETVKSISERIDRIKETSRPLTVLDYLNIGTDERVFSSTLFPLLDTEGKFDSIGSVSMDITELMKAEEEKNSLRYQLAQSQKMEAVGQLAGGVAHDFNNMLSVILGYTEMIMEQLTDNTAVLGELQQVHSAAERSAALTRQLLAFARQQTINPKRVNLNETISALITMLNRIIGEDIALSWIPGENTGCLLIDPTQIDQILVNLCVNAREAITDTGKIIIETDRISLTDEYCAAHPECCAPGKYLMTAVSDSGCGMDRDTVSRIFEPFFTTKGPGKGTGLGLSTVFGIVKQNGGFVNVYSEPGDGTTVRIYLPAADPGSSDADTEIKIISDEPTGNETILVTDDDEAVRNLTIRMLEQLGYRVLAAATPGEALELSRTHSDISLLITDVIMPEMNGKDLFTLIQAEHYLMKCIFISGYTSNVIVHRGVVDEEIHFLQKPFSRNNLAVKVREVLDFDPGTDRYPGSK
jgi:PAS domain S-box-containing protein